MGGVRGAGPAGGKIEQYIICRRSLPGRSFMGWSLQIRSLQERPVKEWPLQRRLITRAIVKRTVVQAIVHFDENEYTYAMRRTVNMTVEQVTIVNGRSLQDYRYKDGPYRDCLYKDNLYKDSNA